MNLEDGNVFDSFRLIITKHALSLIIWPLLSVGLYLASLYSYSLFHIITEIFSIVIAVSLFMIAWNTRRLTKNNYVLFISIAFLFAGLIDFVHTLAYKGMGIFIGYDANLPTQLWIIARYLQGLSLLVAPWFIDRKLNSVAVVGFYLSATLLLLVAVFSGTLFPDCFVEGKGLTPFKIVSEYIICFILICSFVLLFRRREKFDPKILLFITWAIFCTIVSELAFTFYISVYGLSNLIGHFFKIFSFYLIYRAIIVISLENPYSLLFYDLQKNQEEMEIILDSSPIMIFYKDRENKFIRVNKALAEATGLPKKVMEGKTVFEIYPNQTKNYWEDDKEVIASGKPKIGIIEPIDAATGTRWLQTDKIPYRDKEGHIVGIIGFSIDITERKQAEEERRVLILELQEALKKVKLLSGLLPICASCKKIRNDKGYWEQMEIYIRDHSEADFSHSICPECMGKLYPEYHKKK
jgi:PAS domain S-box-containing protein